MNKKERLGFQILFWALIMLLLWYFQRSRGNAIIESISLYTYQIFSILLAANFLAPKYLFEKKYVTFIFSSVFIALLGTVLILILLPIPGHPIPVEERMFHPPRRMPKQSPGLIYFLLLSFSIIIATVIEIVFFVFEKEKQQIISLSEHTETELKLLKSQINPHFLFNALNNIYSLSLLKSEKTSESIQYLSEMLRYVLYDCEKNMVSIQKEVTYIKNYIKLFQLKRSKPFNILVDFSIGSKLDIAPMLLIPFIENAFKHGNLEQENSFINIKLHSNSNGIEFSVVNSFSENNSVKDEVGGIGLMNVKKRLQLLYPHDHILKIEQEEDIFKVTLVLK